MDITFICNINVKAILITDIQPLCSPEPETVSKSFFVFVFISPKTKTTIHFEVYYHLSIFASLHKQMLFVIVARQPRTDIICTETQTILLPLSLKLNKVAKVVTPDGNSGEFDILAGVMQGNTPPSTS